MADYRSSPVTHQLQPGEDLHCPHCHRWHPIMARHIDGTEYTRAMLYWRCCSAIYYAGQIGGTSRFPTRRTNDLIKS